MSCARFHIGTVLLVTILLTLPKSARSQPPPTAGSILQEMAATYAAAQSYSDTSVAKYRNPDGTDRLGVDFRIWFARPSSFRIDALSKSPSGTTPRREVIWSEGAVTRAWATDRPVRNLAKVQIAGSGMFGTYAYHLPTLLEANYGGESRLNTLSQPTLAGEERFEDVDCYRIRGGWDGDPYEVWVGKADHLLRKIVAKYKDHELEEIHRNIAVNQPIPKEIFRFVPENETLPIKPKK